MDEGVGDAALAGRRVGLHVGIGEMDRVIDGEADDDDDEDGLEGSEAPADELEEAEDEGRLRRV